MAFWDKLKDTNNLDNFSDQIDIINNKLSQDNLNISGLNKVKDVIKEISSVDTSDLSRYLELIKQLSNEFDTFSKNINVSKQVKESVSDIIPLLDQASQSLIKVNESAKFLEIKNSISDINTEVSTVVSGLNTLQNSLNNVSVNIINDSQKTQVNEFNNYINNLLDTVKQLQQLSNTNIKFIDENNNQSIKKVVEEINNLLESVNGSSNKLNEFANNIKTHFNNIEESSNEIDNNIDKISNSLEKLNTNSKGVIDLNQNVKEFNVSLKETERLETFSIMSDHIENVSNKFQKLSSETKISNTELKDLDSIVKELNNAISEDFKIQTNFNEILVEATSAKDAILEISKSIKENSSPELLLPQYENIKNSLTSVIEQNKQANDEINKIIFSNPGATTTNEALAVNNKYYEHNINDNNTLKQLTESMIDLLSTFGDAYKNEIDRLQSDLKNINQNNKELEINNTATNIKGFNNLIGLQENDPYNEVLNIALSERHYNDYNDKISKANSNAKNLTIFTEEYEQLLSSNSITNNQKKKIDKHMPDIENISDKAEELEKLNLIYNDSKSTITQNINKAIFDNDIESLEKAKMEYQAILSIIEKMATISLDIGSSLKINTVDELESLPKVVQNIYKESLDLIRNVEDATNSTIKMGEAFGENVDSVKELNKEISKIDDNVFDATAKINDLMRSIKSGINFIKSPINSATRALSTVGIGAGALSLSGIASNVAGYYNQQGKMDYNAYGVDIGLGDNWDLQNAQDAYYRNRIQASNYFKMSGGMIGFEEYGNSYAGLAKNVGAQQGLSSQEAISDLNYINDNTFALSKVYGISDSTMQNAVKSFYQDLRMSAAETTNVINELTQTAKASNIPIDKYINQVASLASQYKKIGLTGTDAVNVMDNMLSQGMSFDRAQSMSTAFGGAMDTFSSNKGLLAFSGVNTGLYNDPWSAIRGGMDALDDKGNVRDDYADKLVNQMDYIVNLKASMTGNHEDAKYVIVEEVLRKDFGLNKNDADQLVDMYLKGDKGFADMLIEKQENKDSIKIEGQDDLLEKLVGMSSQLSTIDKINAEIKSGLFDFAGKYETNFDKLYPFLSSGLNSISYLLGGIFDKVSGMVDSFTGSKLGGAYTDSLINNPIPTVAATYAGVKGAEFAGKNLLKKIITSIYKPNTANNIDDLAGLGDDAVKSGGKLFSNIGDDVAKLLGSKGGKIGLTIAGITAAGLAANHLFGNDNDNEKQNSNNQYYPSNNVMPNYIPNYSTNYNNLQAVYSQPMNLSNMNLYPYTNNDYLYGNQQFNYTDIPYESQANGGLLTSTALSIAGTKVAEKAILKRLGSGMGKAVSGSAGFAIGDVAFGVGDLMSHGFNGTLMGDDFGRVGANLLTDVGWGAGGAALGSMILPGAGTIIGGMLGYGAQGAVNAMTKNEEGDGLIDVLRDAITLMLTGNTQNEIEIKRMLLDSPEKLASNKLQSMGYSKEQADEMVKTMLQYNSELRNLSDEEKIAWAQQYQELKAIGMTEKEIVTSLKSLQLDQSFQSLVDSIKDVVNAVNKRDSGVTLSDTLNYTQKNNTKQDTIMNEVSKDEKLFKKSVDGILSYQQTEKLWDIFNNDKQRYNQIINDPYDQFHDAAKAYEKQKTKETEKRLNEQMKNEAEELVSKSRQDKTNSSTNKNELLMSDYTIQTKITDRLLDSPEALSKYIADNIKYLKEEQKGYSSSSSEYKSLENQIEGLTQAKEYNSNIAKWTQEAKDNFTSTNAQRYGISIGKGLFGKEKTTKNFQEYLEYYLDNQKSQKYEEIQKNALDSISLGQAQLGGKDILSLIKENDKDVLTKYSELVLKDFVKSSEVKETNSHLSSIDKTLKESTQKVAQMTGTTPEFYSSQYGNYIPPQYRNDPYISQSGSISSIDTSVAAHNRSNSTREAEKINQMFKGTALEGYGQAFVDSAKFVGVDEKGNKKNNKVDPYLMASIAMHEVGFEANPDGSDLFKRANNIGGIKSGSIGKDGTSGAYASYNNVEGGIHDLARILSQVYYSDGLKSIEQIQSKYAPNSDSGLNQYWVGGVSKYYNELSGLSDNIMNNVTYGTKGNDMLAIASAQVGSKYIWGAEGFDDWNNDGEAAGGFDCSGLISYAANMAGMNVGRLTAQGLYDKCQKISKSELKPGDLGFIKEGSKITHVGVYNGNDEWVHSSSGQGQVVKEKTNIWTDYGRLPGSQSESGDIDWSKISSGANGTMGSSNISSSSSDVSNLSVKSGVFGLGSMLYGIVPSNYSSYFNNDSNSKMNIPALVGQMIQQGGSSGYSFDMDSQVYARSGRMSFDNKYFDEYSYDKDPYADSVNTLLKASQGTGDKKTLIEFNINASESEAKEIKQIVENALSEKGKTVFVTREQYNDDIGEIYSNLENTNNHVYQLK